MNGMYGADVSQPTGKDDWSSWDVDFGVARCFEEGGQVDEAGAQSIIAGWDAELSRMDGYHFPDTATDAASQAREALGYLVKEGAKIDRYWLDVETTNAHAYWSHDQATNRSFISDWVQAATTFITDNQQLGCSGVGIYTQASYWQTLVGSVTDFAHLPLWWIQVRTPASPQSSMSHWVPFGGWVQPSLLQWNLSNYTGDPYDNDWIPDSNDSSPSVSKHNPRSATYVVRPGDTMSEIAERYNTTVEAIARANGIADPNDLDVGQSLIIPPAP